MGIGQAILRIVYRVAPRWLYGGALAGLRGEHRVLDIGGGMGVLEELLGCRDYMVVVDVDPGMLRHAPRTACTEPVACDAHSLCLRKSSWSGAIVVHDAIHHFEDPARALREAASVLRQGCIHVYDYRPSGPGKILVAAEKLAGFPATFMEPWEVAEALHHLGLRVQTVKADRVGYTVVACSHGQGGEKQGTGRSRERSPSQE